jgi:hypothetical protein
VEGLREYVGLRGKDGPEVFVQEGGKRAPLKDLSWLIAQADLLAWAVEAEAGYSARHVGEHGIEQERFVASHRLASGILAEVIAQRPCRQCGGHGSLMKCPHCGGRGQILYTLGHAWRRDVSIVPRHRSTPGSPLPSLLGNWLRSVEVRTRATSPAGVNVA